MFFLVALCERGKLLGVARQKMIKVLVMEIVGVVDLRVVARSDFRVLAEVAVMDVLVFLGHVSFLPVRVEVYRLSGLAARPWREGWTALESRADQAFSRGKQAVALWAPWA